MKIHGTTKGGALSHKDYGVALGGNGDVTADNIEWDTPLKGASQGGTPNKITATSAGWTNTENISTAPFSTFPPDDTTAYYVGENDPDYPTTNYNQQIGFNDGTISGLNDTAFSWHLGYYSEVREGNNMRYQNTSPSASSTYSITVTSDGTVSYQMDGSTVFTSSATITSSENDVVWTSNNNGGVGWMRIPS